MVLNSTFHAVFFITLRTLEIGVSLLEKKSVWAIRSGAP